MMRFCKQGTPSLQAQQILFTTANAMSNNKTYSGRPKNPAYKFALWKFKFIVFHLNLSKVRERCVIIRNWPRSEIGREKKWYNSPKVDYGNLLANINSSRVDTSTLTMLMYLNTKRKYNKLIISKHANTFSGLLPQSKTIEQHRTVQNGVISYFTTLYWYEPKSN